MEMKVEDVNVIIFDTTEEEVAAEMESTTEVIEETQEVVDTTLRIHDTLLLSKRNIDLMLKDEHEAHNFTFFTKPKRVNSCPKWDDFEIIMYKGFKQEYVRCKNCFTLVAHKKGCGLAGLLRHRCDSVKRKTDYPKVNRILKLKSSNTSSDVSIISALQLEFVVKDLVPPNCMDGAGFRKLAQKLVHYGAQHGTTNPPILLTGADLASRVLPIKVSALRMRIGQLLVEREIAFSYEIWDSCGGKKCVSLDGQCLSDDFALLSFHLGSRIIGSDDIIPVRDGIISILKDYVTAADEILGKSVLVGDEMPCFAKAVDFILKAAESKGGPLSVALKRGFKMPGEDSSDQLDVLTEFYQVFRDCYSSITSPDKTTINEVFLWTKTLEKHLTVNNGDDPIVKDMKDKSLGALHKFQCHRYHYIGLFLDPKFKALKFCSEEEKKAILEIVKEAMATEDVNCEPERTERTPQPEVYFSEFMDSDEEGIISNSNDHIDTELKKYMDWKFPATDILQFWCMNSKFPRLRSLAKKILNIPAAAQKNIFSDNVKMYLEKRRYIEKDNMDSVLFLHENLGKSFITSLQNV